MTYTNEELEFIFAQGNAKVNKSVKLTAADKKSGVKIYCTEPYAQEMYDRYFSSEAGHPMPAGNKDIPVGEIRTVSIKKIDFAMSMVEMEDASTMTSIFVPFREFSQEPSLSLLNEDKDRKYKVMIYKSNMSEILGSEKRCAALTLREDVEYFAKNNKWFYVKVVELIKGGYLAIYKNQIKCFLPGSHAAANVITYSLFHTRNTLRKHFLKKFLIYHLVRNIRELLPIILMTLESLLNSKTTIPDLYTSQISKMMQPLKNLVKVYVQAIKLTSGLKTWYRRKEIIELYLQ
jgi:hypothetical protein